jgi:hypothetical protein
MGVSPRLMFAPDQIRSVGSAQGPEAKIARGFPLKKSVSIPISGRRLRRLRATHRLGQDKAFPPHHPPGPQAGGDLAGRAVARPLYQFPVAELISTDTPGPIVEDSDTFFM